MRALPADGNFCLLTGLRILLGLLTPKSMPFGERRDGFWTPLGLPCGNDFLGLTVKNGS